MERLPDELLLQIAAQLDGPSFVKDLCSLALTSRVLNRVTQDLMYAAPCVEYSRCLRWNDLSKLEPSTLLARTMTERPSLARKMKRLAFKITNNSQNVDRFMNVPEPDMAVEDDDPVDEPSREIRWQSPFERQMRERFERLVGEEATSRRGDCITLAPPLEALELHVVNMQDEDVPRLPSIALFDDHLRTTMPKLPAFTTLRCLTANCPVPWIMLSLPSLRSLNLRMSAGSEVYDDLLSTPGQLRITDLVISISDFILAIDWQLGYPAQTVFSYFKKLISHASNLEHL
jgi:hypothetical protein